MIVPQEAVSAALERMRLLDYTGITRKSVTEALEAAAPLIAAAERDRIRQLAGDRLAIYPADPSARDHRPDWLSFAALLDGDPP